jgi:predicted NodU family carbamoyl transferase
MKYFGIHYFGGRDATDPHHISHDSALTIFDEDGTLEFHGQLERYSRIKRDSKPYTRIYDYFPHLPRPTPNDIVCCVNNTAQVLEDKNILYLDHHLAHACASWCFRPDDKPRDFLVYDGYGRGVDGSLNHSLTGRISATECVIGKANTIPSSIHLGKPLGIFNVGKLMGLAGYLPDAPLVEDVNFNHLNSLTPDRMEQAAGFYKYHIDKIWQAIEPQINGPVIIGGGTTLALELNTRIFQKAKDVVFAPCADDSGISLGCAAYAFFSKNGQWPHAFINASLINQQVPHTAEGPQTPREIAKLLAEEQICAVVRGKSECGPRALGNRSIFASAKTIEMKVKVSEKIKGREFYRPLAPIVTDRDFPSLFDGPMGKYMQYMVYCTEEAQQTIPAVVHTDLTARPQVVYPEDEWLYELLVEYGKLSGVECLINTSLNTGGRPIAENSLYAKVDLKDHDVAFCIIGDKKFIKL